MINEEELSYKRGEVSSSSLALGDGPKRLQSGPFSTPPCSTGRGGRQIWILDMDDATPELDARWKNKKMLVPGEISSLLIPEVPSEEILSCETICFLFPFVTSSVASLKHRHQVTVCCSVFGSGSSERSQRKLRNRTNLTPSGT